MTHESLLARLREAKGPDRSIDAEIATLMGMESRSTKRGRQWLEDSHGGEQIWLRHPPPYTSSVDVILALIKRGLPRFACGFDSGPKTSIAFVDRHDYADRMFGARWTAEAATPALALCIAFVSALSAIAASEGEKP